MREQGSFFLLLKPYRFRLVIAFLAMAGTHVLALVVPWALKILIDTVLPAHDIRRAQQLLWVLAGSSLLKCVCGFVREYIVAVTGERIVYDVRSALCEHIQRLSVAYAQEASRGETLSRIITDVEAVRDFLFGAIIDFFYSFFNIVLIAGLLCALDWRLALVSYVWLPATAGLFLRYTPVVSAAQQDMRALYGKLTGRLQEILDGMRVVAGFNQGEYEIGRLRGYQEDLRTTAVRSHRAAIILWMGSDLISALGLIVCIGFGVRAVFSGRITIGTFIAFYTYVGMLLMPVVRIASMNTYYQQAKSALQRIFRLLEEKPAVKEVSHPVSFDTMKGTIVFCGVSFNYPGGRPALADVSFRIEPRTSVAFVGRSGAGKTTVINLLLRFYDPSAGRILIDGHDLKTVGLTRYRSQIAMVMQDDYLFGGTVRENICYGNQKAPMSTVIRSAQLAHAHEFIMELPQEYETQIGEGGVRLSFGQRQRLSIARAFLRDPAILILDEATSSVDSATERMIIEDAYRHLVRGRTTVMIAHRLSTVKDADTIIVLEGGRIVEQGTHGTLLRQDGHYGRLWQKQSVQYSS